MRRSSHRRGGLSSRYRKFTTRRSSRVQRKCIMKNLSLKKHSSHPRILSSDSWYWTLARESRKNGNKRYLIFSKSKTAVSRLKTSNVTFSFCKICSGWSWFDDFPESVLSVRLLDQNQIKIRYRLSFLLRYQT